MAEETFSTNVMRLIAAELHFQSVLSASREMFGRSYFSLGPIEKAGISRRGAVSSLSRWPGRSPAMTKTCSVRRRPYPIPCPFSMFLM